MEKRSILKKLIIVLMIAMLLPALMPAQDTCTGSCTSCPSGSADCTWTWAYSSWDNMLLYMMAMTSGTNFVVCCSA